MSKSKKPIDFDKEYPVIEYYAYMGKRLSDGKLLHCYIQCDEDGRQLMPEEKNNHYISKKFPYAKRPRVGGIYRIKLNEKKTSFLIEDDYRRFMGKHWDAAKWEIKHKLDALEMEHKKHMTKVMNTSELDKLTINELKELMKTIPLSQRRYIVTYIITSLL